MRATVSTAMVEPQPSRRLGGMVNPSFVLDGGDVDSEPELAPPPLPPDRTAPARATRAHRPDPPRPARANRGGRPPRH
ncbi:hypothetical protein V6N13_037536 [Hibiscus sabdariffa]